MLKLIISRACSESIAAQVNLLVMKVLPHLICLEVLLVPVLCQTGLSVTDKETILNVHNAVRKMVTVASNMQHMVGYGTTYVVGSTL